MAKSKEALNVRQAAAALGVGIHRLYELIWEGKLAAERVDGVWSIPESAIRDRKRAKEAWEHESCVQS